MAEFKNLVSQIEVIGSTFSDTINLYKKSNSDQVVQLGVYASSGDVILTKVDPSGNTIGQPLETYKFSDISNPSLASIDLMVEQINTWIHDEVREVTVDTPLTGAGGELDGLKVSIEHSYDCIKNIVTVSDKDVDFVVSVFNETLNKMVYMRGSEEYTGVISGDSIILDITLTGATNGDCFYVIFKPNPEIGIRSVLESIDDRMEQNNKILTKIYNPE